MDMESLATWVDVSSVNSVCSGLIIIGLAFWSRYMLARLWQKSLLEDCEAAILRADALGLRLCRTGFRCRIAARGTLSNRDASVSWKGGALGQRSVVTLGDRVRRLPLITDARSLDAAFDSIRESIATEEAPKGPSGSLV